MTKKKFAQKIKNFLDLSQEKKAEWINNNIPDFEMYCHGDGYLGAFYPVDIDLSKYLSDRNEYGLSSLIVKQDPEIDNERIQEIDAGADLTKAETYFLCQSIAQNDFKGWLTHNSFEIDFLDGNVFLYFQGESINKNSFDFKFHRAFTTYKSMLEFISELPFSYVE